MKVIVCQHGARRRYAVPRILETAGMLAALYTDSCEHSLLGRMAKAMGPLAKGTLKRLANRRIAGIPQNKIFSTDRPFWLSMLDRTIIQNAESRRYRKHCLHLSNAMMKWYKDVPKSIIYNMYCENLTFVAHAYSRGYPVVIDVYQNPSHHHILASEYKTILPDYDYEAACSDFKEAWFCDVAKHCSILLCPSEWVANAVRGLCPEHAHKIRMCPYGASIDYGGRVNKPIKGRILWAGVEWVRKGLHYLAAAADELKPKYPELDFRVAGVTDPEVMQMPMFKNINFLGKLDKARMQEEFLSVDMFVFPTLSEGMAGVVVEALVAGCPVITTKAAGVDAIEDGISGMLIKPSAVEVRVAIEQVYLDRELRDNLSEESLKLRSLFTVETRANRLIAIIRELTKE